jgi:hypothetical protein
MDDVLALRLENKKAIREFRVRKSFVKEVK